MAWPGTEQPCGVRFALYYDGTMEKANGREEVS